MNNYQQYMKNVCSISPSGYDKLVFGQVVCALENERLKIC